MDLSNTVALFRGNCRSILMKAGHEAGKVDSVTNVVLCKGFTDLCEEFRANNPKLELSAVQVKSDISKYNAFFSNIELENWTSAAIRVFYRWLVIEHKSKLVLQHPTVGKMTVQIKVKIPGRSITLTEALNETPSRIHFVVRSPAGTNPGDKVAIGLLREQYKEFNLMATQIVEKLPNGAHVSRGIRVQADSDIVSDPKFGVRVEMRTEETGERKRVICRSKEARSCGMVIEVDGSPYVIGVMMHPIMSELFARKNIASEDDDEDVVLPQAEQAEEKVERQRQQQREQAEQERLQQREQAEQERLQQREQAEQERLQQREQAERQRQQEQTERKRQQEQEQIEAEQRRQQHNAEGQRQQEQEQAERDRQGQEHAERQRHQQEEQAEHERQQQEEQAERQRQQEQEHAEQRQKGQGRQQLDQHGPWQDIDVACIECNQPLTYSAYMQELYVFIGLTELPGWCLQCGQRDRQEDEWVDATRKIQWQLAVDARQEKKLECSECALTYTISAEQQQRFVYLTGGTVDHSPWCYNCGDRDGQEDQWETKNYRQRPQCLTKECSEDELDDSETELPVEDTNPQSAVRDAQGAEWIDVRRIRRRQLAEDAKQSQSLAQPPDLQGRKRKINRARARHAAAGASSLRETWTKGWAAAPDGGTPMSAEDEADDEEIAVSPPRDRLYEVLLEDTKLGITTRSECGVLVITTVANGSNASRVGVLPGSVIMAVAGRDVCGIAHTAAMKLIRDAPRPFSMTLRDTAKEK